MGGVAARRGLATVSDGAGAVVGAQQRAAAARRIANREMVIAAMKPETCAGRKGWARLQLPVRSGFSGPALARDFGAGFARLGEADGDGLLAAGDLLGGTA